MLQKIASHSKTYTGYEDMVKRGIKGGVKGGRGGGLLQRPVGTVSNTNLDKS